MDAAGVREKSGWFAAGAVALDGPIAAAFWSFLCVIVWRFRSCVEWCVQATDVSERSRNGSAYLGWLMPCVCLMQPDVARGVCIIGPKVK